MDDHTTLLLAARDTIREAGFNAEADYGYLVVQREGHVGGRTLVISVSNDIPGLPFEISLFLPGHEDSTDWQDASPDTLVENVRAFLFPEEE